MRLRSILPLGVIAAAACTTDLAGPDLDAPCETGEIIESLGCGIVTGKVVGTDGVPLSDVLVSVWRGEQTGIHVPQSQFGVTAVNGEFATRFELRSVGEARPFTGTDSLRLVIVGFLDVGKELAVSDSMKVRAAAAMTGSVPPRTVVEFELPVRTRLR